MIRARPAIPVALAEAQGLVLADDVVAQLSLPVFDNSAMDGYAVRAEDTSGATPEHPVLVPVAATDGGVGSVAIREAPQPGKHIRRAGEDVAAGTTVLREGQLVTPAML